MVWRLILPVFFFGCASSLFGDPNEMSSDWQQLWKPRHMESMPAPQPCQIERTGTLGDDLAGQSWKRVKTQYHTVYFTPTIEPQKLRKIYLLIDNLYEFLQARSPEQSKPAAVPITVFLVPNQLKRSRCCPEINAMRTGDRGNVTEIITSLLHEETHLFNMASLNGKPQGWWLGEFSCQYFQTRAGLVAERTDIRRHVRSKLPQGPAFRLNEMEKAGRDAFEEAFAALYFLEERYGADALGRFRSLYLKAARTGHPAGSASFCAEAFGENAAAVEKNWFAFYGWDESVR